MYEAVRTHAPVSTKAVGLLTTLMITAAAGYVMANGFGAKIAEMVETVTTIATLPPDEKPVAEDPIERKEIVIDLPMPPIPPVPDPFVSPDKPPPITIPNKPVVDAGAAPGPLTPARAPVRVGAIINARDKPAYPAASIRAEEEGVTGLEVCVDARGRVTSATLAKSSGHARLDEAALKWVREARFRPGKVDGAAQAMCGQPVTYEWNLDRT